MPSRRAYLGAVGTVTLATAAGCLSRVLGERIDDARIQYVVISVDTDERSDVSAEHDVLNLQTRLEERIHGTVAAEFTDLVDDDGTLAVTPERHRELEAAYAGVRYSVSFCSGDLDSEGSDVGCRAITLPHEKFEKVQFGGAHSVDVDGRRVLGVEEGSIAGWDVDIRAVDTPPRADR